MDKKQRQAAILSIIVSEEIETQQDLQLRLQDMGIHSTQATLSRDIRELRIQKGLSENGINCYFSPSLAGTPRYNSLFAQAVESLDYAMNTVVIKTRSGLANAACAVLDEQDFEFVVGTIAGDDTIFVLTRSESHAVQLIGTLKKMTMIDY